MKTIFKITAALIRTVNGNFELQNKPNRRILFDTKKDTTYVNLVFNKE
ncbi:hypothetical protein [Flavobacterium sp. N1994]|nr:hypothetical protein [Flavobacterium sp. N1994]